MKNIYIIPLIIVVSLFSFILNNVFFATPEYVKVLQHQKLLPELMITQTQLDDYLLNLEDRDGKNIIIERTLSAIGYQQWLEYIDYIDIIIYKEMVMDGEGDQLIIVMNLSKDLAVAVIYLKENDFYIYNRHIDNLVKVDYIQFIPHPNSNYNMMVIHQILDESFGAFLYERFVDIYCFIDDNFKLVWQKTLFYKEIYNESWLNPRGDIDKWHMVIEESAIDFSLKYPLKVNTITTLKKYTASSKIFPNEESFNLTESRSFSDTYIWEDEYQTFIIGEIPASVFIFKAAVLADMENDISTLFGIKNKNLKLMNSRGQVFYLPKNILVGMLKTSNQ